jgi:hypothetical protein
VTEIVEVMRRQGAAIDVVDDNAGNPAMVRVDDDHRQNR